MQYLEILPGIRSSQLGMGCSSMMGSIGRAQSLRALEVAFENGINHFDVARSYGFGEAEGLLGAFIKDKRDKVVITTKFGILPQSRVIVSKWLKPVARSIITTIPILHPMISSLAATSLRAGNYDPAGMKASIEESLKQLAVDHIEYLMFHELPPDFEVANSTANELEILKRRGLIRGWGISGRLNIIRQFIAHVEQQPDLLQIHCSVEDSEYPEIRALPSLPKIICGPFGGKMTTAKPDNKTRFSATLRKVVSDHPESVVICTMINPSHILHNVDALNDQG